MHRLDTPELLDEHDAPRADMERSLRDLRRFNSLAGGTRVYRAIVRRLLGDRPGVVIDLGAGTGDLVGSIGARLPVAVDLNIRHLLYQRDRSPVRRVVADALHLPFRDKSADAVTSSHFFHHFTPEQNGRIIADAQRVARAGLAFTDTRRHLAPLLFTLALGWFRLVGRITRADAPGSVRRGYTTEEVREIAKGAVVENYFPFRWVMLLWT